MDGIDEETIIIVAVARLHRKPFYWTRRVWKQILPA